MRCGKSRPAIEQRRVGRSHGAPEERNYNEF
jgi:hypothetical protein